MIKLDVLWSLMFRLFFICFYFLLSAMYASNTHSENFLEDQHYQIFANDLKTKNNIVTAVGDVVVFSQSYYMSAQKVIYNKEHETFELFNNVIILHDNEVQSNSNYTFIDMKLNQAIQHPTLLLSSDSALWIRTSNSLRQGDIIELQQSVLSTCDCHEPDWTIAFSKAKIDTANDWIETYHNRIMVGSTPILYLPYWRFPTNQKRKTGLLKPTLGRSSKDGFYINQPVYIAPKDHYDIELIPQIRSKRGQGLYSYLRYADSMRSMLHLSAGFFRDRKSYFIDNNLKSQQHFGYNIFYHRDTIFSSHQDRDGLYIDIDWINDIDYKNLEDKSHREGYSRTIESKINYFYNKPKYYGGIYFQHYLDMSLDSNDTTLHKLPQAQFHTYSRPFLSDKLLYSFDTLYTNYTRKEGVNANQIDMSIPLSYRDVLMDGYIYFAIDNVSALSDINYTNTSGQFQDAMFIENKTIFTLGSDLTKPYKNYIHTANASIDFTFPKTVSKKGDLYGISSSDTVLEPFSFEETNKTVNFSLNHSLYDRDELTKMVNHKVKQSVIYNDFETTLSNLENEVVFNHALGSLNNRLVYSQEDHTLVESSSGLGINYKDYSFDATYYVSKDSLYSDLEESESVTFKLDWDLSDRYTLSYQQEYNINDNSKSKEIASFDINDKCWSFNVKYSKELLASANNITSSYYQDILYFTFELKEIGGVNITKDIKE